MTWSYRACPVCSPGKWSSEHGPAPVVSVLVQLSTLAGRKERVQKSTGSLPMCAGCMEKLIAGRMPKTMRERLARCYAELKGE